MTNGTHFHARNSTVRATPRLRRPSLSAPSRARGERDVPSPSSTSREQAHQRVPGRNRSISSDQISAERLPVEPSSSPPARCARRPWAHSFLSWSHDMVAMYQARRNRAIEKAANTRGGRVSRLSSGYLSLTEEGSGRRPMFRPEFAAEETGRRAQASKKLVATCRTAAQRRPRGDGSHLWQRASTRSSNGLEQPYEALCPRASPADRRGNSSASTAASPCLTREAQRRRAPNRRVRWRKGARVGPALGGAKPGRRRFWAASDTFDPHAPHRAPARLRGGAAFSASGAPLARAASCRSPWPALYSPQLALRSRRAAALCDLYHFQRTRAASWSSASSRLSRSGSIVRGLDSTASREVP